MMMMIIYIYIKNKTCMEKKSVNLTSKGLKEGVLAGILTRQEALAK